MALLQPAIDCRDALDELLFENPHLEVCLQFLLENQIRWHEPPLDPASFMWIAYVESLVNRLRDGDSATFVRSLWIR